MDIQQLVAIFIAVAASAYLLRRSVLSLRTSGGCGSCDACPTGSEENQEPTMPVRKQLYSLDRKQSR